MQPLLCAIFFVSGMSALVFETLWFRQMGLALGNSIWASSLVLAGFMAGQALGNAAAARRGDRSHSPIAAYAILETLIGLSGFALVVGLPLLGPLLAPILGPLRDAPLALNGMRLGAAFTLLLVPSTAMGATLPLLCRALVQDDSDFGVVLGRLYGWNTLGAVLGPITAEAIAIEWLGIRGTAAATAAANLFIAVAAVGLSRHAHSPERVTGDGSATSWFAGARWLWAAFGAGLALLSLELIWFRLLILFVPGTAFTFALMLSIVLAGIGAGGLAGSAWARRNPLAWEWAAPVALAAGIASIAGYVSLQWIIGPLEPGRMPGFLEIARLGLPLMGSVAFLSGMFFTLVGQALRIELSPSATAAGRLSLANTVGAALGSLLAGFVLLPALGTERSILTVALIYTAIGAALFRAARAHPVARLATAVALGLALAFFPWGLMESRYLRFPIDRWTPNATLLGAREGLTETILYTERDVFGQPYEQFMLTNSYTMSGTHWAARRYMKLYVYLPVAVHPDLERALLISYGVGSTAKALVDTPSIRRIDVVDISRDVLEMNGLIHRDPATHPLRDPRVTTHVEDGRQFLQTTDQEFDLITGEPPPPIIAGVVSLYTEEYFGLIRSRLAPGGIATYWLPTQSLPPESRLAVLAAFCSNFPDCSLWHGRGSDLMMVGTRGATGPVSVEFFEAQWRNPSIARELRVLGLEHPEQLGALFIGDSEYLRTITHDVEPLRDDRPTRVQIIPRAGDRMPIGLSQWRDMRAAWERFRHSDWISRLWPPRMIKATLPFFEVQEIINRRLFAGSQPANLALAHYLLTRHRLRTPALWSFESDGELQRIVSSLPAAQQLTPEVQLQLGVGALTDGDLAAAEGHLARASQDPNLRDRALPLHVYALCRAGRGEAAALLAGKRLRANADASPNWTFLRAFCLTAVDQRARRDSDRAN